MGFVLLFKRDLEEEVVEAGTVETESKQRVTGCNVFGR